MKSKSTYIVFSVKMMNWLVRQGFDVIAAVDSPKDPTGYYKAFLFENSDKLQATITSYNKLIKKNEDITKNDQTTISHRISSRKLQNLDQG